MKLTALNHSLLFEYKKSSDGKAILLHRRQGLPRVRDVLSCVCVHDRSTAAASRRRWPPEGMIGSASYY